MTPAAITDEIDIDLDHALDVMAEYGVRQAELREVYDRNISAVDAAGIERIKRATVDRGVSIVCLASPFYKTDLPGVDKSGDITGPLHGATALAFEEQLAMLRGLLRTARELNATIIRTFTFWKHGDLTEQIEDLIVASYREPAKMASDAGVVLAIENEPSCYAGTGREVGRIVDRVGSSGLKAVWDPANVVYGGGKADRAEYGAVRSGIAHVHFKDATFDAHGNTKCVLAGDGMVDWAEQMNWLTGDGYTGAVSLETHTQQGGKEAASRMCLAALVRLLEQAQKGERS
jgi:sugar phosphate isomerase/epimerase